MASIYRPTYRNKDGSVRQTKTWYGRVKHEGQLFRKSLATESRQLAKTRLQEWLNELKAARWGDRKSIPFREAAARFVDEHFERIKPAAAKRYVVSLKNLDRFFGDLMLDEITKARMSEFETARRKEGVRDGTIRRDLSCLSALFRCAEEWEWHDGNPARSFLRAASKRGLTEAPPRTRYASHEEEETILAAILERARTAKSERARHGARMLYAATVLAIDTGLRREELFGLTWRDVDLEKKEITVVAERAKSSHMRQVPILPRSLELLGRMVGGSSPFVLHRLDGKRYVDLVQQFDRLTEKLGIADLTWHDLRKTCGCRLLQDHEMPMEKVSLWLGHESITITERAYAFLNVRHLHEHLAKNKTKRIGKG